MARTHAARFARYRHHDKWFQKNVKHDHYYPPSPKERITPVEDQLHDMYLESRGVELDNELPTRPANVVDEPWEDHSDCDQCNGYSDWDDMSWSSEGDYESDLLPSDPVWAYLWVDGLVSDPDGRDDPPDWCFRGDMYEDHHDDWHDWLDDLENPLLEREDVAVTPLATAEAVQDRALERHRAGERYFRAFRRTV